MLRQLIQHLHRLFTRPQAELSLARRTWHYLVELVKHCARQLMEDRAEEMAAALAYRTIFSLVPMLALGLVIFRLFGGIDEVQASLQSQIFEYFGVPEVTYSEAIEESERIDETTPADGLHTPSGSSGPGAPAKDAETQRRVQVSLQITLAELIEKVSNLSFTSIGVIGAILFIYAAMALAFSVEYDFDIIFNSPTGRPWHLRIAIYWSIITLGSGLLALSLYFSGQVIEWVGGFNVYGSFVFLLSHLLALLATWLLLFLLYRLMPNTHVKSKPALIGSGIAALLWEAGKIGFQFYVNRTLPYATLYGALGLIPLFLFWIYISWLIVLFGLELAYTLQVMHGKVPTPEEEKPPPLSGDPDWVVPVLAEVGRAFVEGKTLGRQDLAEKLGLPTRIINDYGRELAAAGLIHCMPTGADGDQSYVLARPPESIRIRDVLRLGHELTRHRERLATSRDWELLDRLQQAQYDAVGDTTLAHLLAEQTPSEPDANRGDGRPAAETDSTTGSGCNL